MVNPPSPAGQAPSDDARPIDATSERRLELHHAEYGDHAISYQQAFDLAVVGVLTREDGETPRAILVMDAEASGQTLTKDELDQKTRALVAAGDFELLPVGETDEGDEDPAKKWIFAVNVDTDSDERFWASVDRDTGEVVVSGFN